MQQVPGLVFGAALVANSQSSRDSDTQFPQKPRDRLAVTSYPFRAFINSPNNRSKDNKSPRIDLIEFPALIATKFGVCNINPLGDHFRATDPGYLEAFRGAVAKANSHVVDLGLGGRPFYDKDPSVRKAAVEFGRKWIDIAAAVGSPSVRQHVSRSPGQKPDVALAAEGLGQLAEYGAKRNIIVNLENDDPVSEDPFFLVNVIKQVNSQYLRALPDFGNSLLGHDPDYNARAVEAMFRFAHGMSHVKDTVQSEDGKTFHVDLAKMFGIAKASSYRGYFSMEFETELGDPFAGTQALVRETLQYL